GHEDVLRQDAISRAKRETDRRRPYHAVRRTSRTVMVRPMTATASAGPATGRDGTARRQWRVDALLLGLLPLLLRFPALVAARSLVFDDGVFAASALAMRRGGLPFRDVFSSQGPVFLPLVWVGDLLGFRTLDAPRVLSVASGIVVTVAAY